MQNSLNNFTVSCNLVFFPILNKKIDKNILKVDYLNHYLN